jgi:regulatory protein
MLYKKSLTPDQAFQKLKHYCAYQERCHSEVKNKLYELGIRKKDHDELIAKLIEENYLDEERFAIAFAGGKFRMKDWGKTRIKYELKSKLVSEYNIKKALKQIDEKVYLNTLKKLAQKKYTELKKDQWMVRRKKIMDYLLAKGYEPELIYTTLAQIIDPSKAQ